MKICVLGAGVIGVSTAYALSRTGHDVSVIDKDRDVAGGASHANGAQLSYSYVDPFSGPHIVKKLPGYLLGTDPAIQLGLSLRPDYLKWGVDFLRNCNATKFKDSRNTRRDLARLSREAISLFEQDLPQNSLTRTGRGKLILAQTESENRTLETRVGTDEFIEHDQRYLSPEECMTVEPALKGWTGTVLGGLFSPNDNALDPVTYCKVLRRSCEDDFGVKFYFNQNALNIRQNSIPNFVIETDVEKHDCDKIIVCLGNDPKKLLKPLNVSLPIYPMQGYSLTLPVIDQSPVTSVTDLKNKIVFANLGTHMRIAGFVDANQSPKKSQTRSEQLLKIAKLYWPNVADYEGHITRWTNFRPMTPSGIPVIGQTKVPGLYINAGHGTLGYTFAAGSAMKIATEIGHVNKNTSQFEDLKNAFL